MILWDLIFNQYPGCLFFFSPSLFHNTISFHLFFNVCTKAALKEMTPTLLCWPAASEADVRAKAVEVEHCYQYSVTFCWLAVRLGTDPAAGPSLHLKFPVATSHSKASRRTSHTY